jgi:hypothetical protein
VTRFIDRGYLLFFFIMHSLDSAFIINALCMSIIHSDLCHHNDEMRDNGVVYLWYIKYFYDDRRFISTWEYLYKYIFLSKMFNSS